MSFGFRLRLGMRLGFGLGIGRGLGFRVRFRISPDHCLAAGSKPVAVKT